MTDLHAAYSEAEKLMDDEKLDAAAEKLSAILAEDGTFVLGHLALSRCCTKLGRHLEAIEHSKRACELEPNEAFNYTAMSIAYQRAWAGTGEQKYIQLAEDARDAAHRVQH